MTWYPVHISRLLLPLLLVLCACSSPQYADGQSSDSEEQEALSIPVELATGGSGVRVFSDHRLLTVVTTDAPAPAYDAQLGLLRFSTPDLTYGASVPFDRLSEYDFAAGVTSEAAVSRLSAAEWRLVGSALRVPALSLSGTLIFDLDTALTAPAAWLTFRLQAYRSLFIPTIADTASCAGPTQFDDYAANFGIALDGSPLRVSLLCTEAYDTDVTFSLLDAQYHVLATYTAHAVSIAPADTQHIDLSPLTMPSAYITIDTTYTDTIYYTL